MIVATIDSTGFHRPRLDEILSDLTSELQGIYGQDVDTSDSSPDMIWLNANAERIDAINQLAESVYNARSPAGSIGAGLSRLVKLNGIQRKTDAFSEAPITLSGTPGTVIQAGSIISHEDDPTITGTTDPNGGSLTIGGGGTVTGTWVASSPGPVLASANKLTVIGTVIGGWNSVTNTADASPGSLAETDPQLRTRRSASVAIPAQSILDGMFASISAVDNVVHARVWENPEDVPLAMPGGGTLPPHSMNVIADGGTAADIAAAIWLKKTGGVTLVGAQTQDIVDAQGETHTMKYDRPIDADIYISIVTSEPIGSGTQTLIKNAIVAWGASTNTTDGVANSGYNIANDVIWSQIFIPINTIPGLSVSDLAIGLAPAPTGHADLVIPFNAISRWDASRIVITP
ncbi:MAG TPA: baseplate J/gp47 family protein [Terriglobia bacterium]|nr:baseplate J/gp47 family protein [Terriglobia bacterium]